MASLEEATVTTLSLTALEPSLPKADKKMSMEDNRSLSIMVGAPRRVLAIHTLLRDRFLKLKPNGPRRCHCQR